MLKKFLVRLRNPKVITAVVSGILMILVNLGLLDSVISGHILDGVNTLLGIGVTIGIFGDPESHLKE